jgi:hypothetical protein
MRADGGRRQPHHSATRRRAMQTDEIDTGISDGGEGATWTSCADCGQLDHPAFTCEEAVRLVRERIHRDHAPVILAALDDAAEARIERTKATCPECSAAPPLELCPTHTADRERAEEYHQVADTLRAALDL